MGPRGVKLKGSGVSTGDDERVLGTDSDDGYTALPMYFHTAELHTYEGLK